MKRIILLSVLLAFFLQSCIISLHPLYTDDVIVYNKNIEGRWQQGPVEGSDYVIWDFKRQKKGYEVHRYYKGDTLSYEAVLVQLGEHYFMDFYRQLPDDFQDDLSRVLPTHNFLKLSFSGQNLKLVYFDHKYLERLFKERKIRIKHEKVGSDIVLTASSKELQQFMLKYAEDENAFHDSFELLEKIAY